MKSIADLLNTQQQISRRQFGLQRAMHAPIIDLQQTIRQAEANPELPDLWAHVILASFECALRSGATPFAIGQAVLDAQRMAEARRSMPPLAQFVDPAKVDRQAPAAKPDAAAEATLDEEYGPASSS